MDWLAGSLTALVILLFQRQRLLAANALGVVAQGPWIALIFTTKTYGLLPLEVLITGIYLFGLWRAFRARKRSA